MKIDTSLENEIDFTKMPEHVAIIMDGNRRWAKKNKLPAIAGHKKGANTLTDIVKAAQDFKIKTLTVFAFSTENWNRSKDEVRKLMDLYEKFLKKQLAFLVKEKIRLNVIGDLSKCPKSLQDAFSKVIEQTQMNDKLNFIVAINYGSKDEIKRAFLKMLSDYDSKKISKEDISENLISSYLDNKNFKEPDLFIRTSGEKRLSNFMLWQLAYAEIYITDTFWPDFNENEFLKAILEYQKRKRRFGGA